METKNEIEKQIETAYDYRGHVTIKLKSGESIEGFVFNRQFAGTLLKEEPFIEVFLKASAERKKYPISTVDSVTLTGEDCAAETSPKKIP